MATQWMVISEFDDSLAALFYRCAAKYVDVWFMREYGVRNSWNRLYTVQVDGFTRAIVFRKNGEILMTRYPSDEVVSCDPQRKEIHDLQNLGLSDYADCYVESLALLDELKEENEKET